MRELLFIVAFCSVVVGYSVVVSMSSSQNRPAPPPPTCQQKLLKLEKELIKVEILCRAMTMACQPKETL